MGPLVTPPSIPRAAADEKLDNVQYTQYATQKISELPSWIQTVALRVQTMHPLPGSRFEFDDALKPTNPPSEQTINLLRSGLDHLHAVADAVEAGGPRPLAGFTLIRSAIEACALAAWLMLPGTMDARLRNSIRLSVQNRRDTETYTKRFEPDGEVRKWFYAEMTATKNGRPDTKNMDLEQKFPTITSILQTTDRHQRFKGLAGIDAWRACSGIAHSNAQFAGSAVNRVESEHSINVTVKPTTLLLMLEPAQRYLEFSVGLAERHLSPDPKKAYVAAKVRSA